MPPEPSNSGDANAGDDSASVIARVTDQLIEHIGSIEDAAGLEWVAAKLGVAIADPTAPAGTPEAIVRSLEERSGTEGVALLAAIERTCPGKAAGMAAAGVRRLGERGLEPELPVGLGQHEFEKAASGMRDGHDYYAFFLRRPMVELVEMGYFSTRRGKWNGVLHEGILTRPLERADADRILEQVEGRGEARAEATSSISAKQLAAVLRGACARTIELEGNAEFELWFALQALARALGLAPDMLPAPRNQARRQGPAGTGEPR